MKTPFHQALHHFALKVAADLSDDGDEGDPAPDVKLHGRIGSNYPWLYVDYQVRGRMDMNRLNSVVSAFQTFSTLRPEHVSFLNVSVSPGQVEEGEPVAMNMRVRLIYREDLPK